MSRASINNEHIFLQITTTKSFYGRLALLEQIDMSIEDQPWCYTQYFTDICDHDEPMHSATMIADIFMRIGGPIIIEAEASYHSGKYITIMDEFETDEGWHPVSQWLLKRAFRQAGFKRADECDQEQLKSMYLAFHADGSFRE